MSTVEVQGRNVIGGVLVEAEDGQRLDVIEPATGAVLATVPAGGEADADRAVEAARAALPAWLETTPAERSAYLLTLADVNRAARR
jgi:acyl-CoA reductase-like NAD-dependent aldehyde dehydrogenase